MIHAVALLLVFQLAGEVAARGFATGPATDGIGTARALQESKTAGAIWGMGMGRNAILTALIAPIIIQFFIQRQT